MELLSIRRLTNDTFHNAYTGACWFHGELYIAYRQAYSLICSQGRILVRRSLDGGTHFDTVHVARGQADTRNTHLYSADDQRLYLVGHETYRGHENFAETPVRWRARGGSCWTDNGLNWSSWTPFSGADGWGLFHPAYFAGVHYYGGFRAEPTPAVAWFDSPNGIEWTQRDIVLEGDDRPTECALTFMPDGEAVMLVRREHPRKTPVLLRAYPPYRHWQQQALDLPLECPVIWNIEGTLYAAGRWYSGPGTVHVAVFAIVDDRLELQIVLPSGPNAECGYLSQSRRPGNRHRFSLAYYSGHVAPDNTGTTQWGMPDIFVADALFDPPFITDWLVSEVDPLAGGLLDATCPDPTSGVLHWTPMTAMEGGNVPGFVDAKAHISDHSGIVYFVTDLTVDQHEEIMLHLGYDGQIRVWFNDLGVFQGVGTNPACPDLTSVRMRTRPGLNRLAIALDTYEMRGTGIFARYEPV